MTWGRAGLTNLVQVGHERQHRLPFAAEVHKRFTAAERRLRCTKEFQDNIRSLIGVRLAIGLFLCPARASNKQQLRIRPDGLGIAI